MIRDEVKALLADAVDRAIEAGDLPRVAVPDVTLDRPKSQELGDYASPLALKMARGVGRPPLEVAGAITAHLQPGPSIAAVETARPGFINFHLATAWLQQQVDDILRDGPRYGAVPLGAGARVQVEFVSANPTGPLHVGAARNAALGDTIANLLSLCGFDVQREYYVNNAGSRIEALAASIFARYCQVLGIDEPVPEDGYPGEYLLDLAAELVEQRGRRYLDLPREQAIAELARVGVDLVLEWIRADLRQMRVEFDRFYEEQSIFDSGLFERTLALLRDRGYVLEREGAVWFASSELGEDKDNVLVRSNGQPTYFASDIAYHYDKLVARGFERVIDVWAADHQGHVPRMKAMARAIGVDPDRLTILMYQLVRLIKDGRPVKIGKRTGDYVTIRDALDEIGPDALRFFLVHRSAEAMMDLDVDLATKRTNANPVYYVQYGHARCASIFRNAAELGLSAERGDVHLLSHPAELAVIRKLLQLPEIVETAVADLAPHHLPHYAHDLTQTFTEFYDHEECRVLPGRDKPVPPDLSAARLKLVGATRQVLANVLGLIGVSAPDQMLREEQEPE